MLRLTRPARILLPAAGLAALVGFAACSPDSTDFQSEGEKFIENTDGDVTTQTGYSFSDASCDKPTNTDTGTTYACTAADEEGDSWDFTVEITGDRELTVTGAFHPKVVRDFVVESVAAGGTVDETCVDGLVADAPDDVLRDLVGTATLSADAEALLTDLLESASTSCVS